MTRGDDDQVKKFLVLWSVLTHLTNGLSKFVDLTCTYLHVMSSVSLDYFVAESLSVCIDFRKRRRDVNVLFSVASACVWGTGAAVADGREATSMIYPR